MAKSCRKKLFYSRCIDPWESEIDHNDSLMKPVKTTNLADGNGGVSSVCDAEKVGSNVQSGTKQGSGGNSEDSSLASLHNATDLGYRRSWLTMGAVSYNLLKVLNLKTSVPLEQLIVIPKKNASSCQSSVKQKQGGNPKKHLT